MAADQPGQPMDSRGAARLTKESPKILWDETGMRSTYANITKVTGSHEEIKITFGVEEARHADLHAVGVRLSNQVVMRPVIAKKLALVLADFIRKYEETWGMINAMPAPSTSSPGERIGSALEPEGEISTENADTLFRHIRDLDVKVAFERSFKALPGQLLDNRFLLGINQQDLAGPSDERVETVCKAIGMPRNLLDHFKRQRPDANHIYFGFEEGEKTAVYKVYVEFRDKIEKEMEGRETGSQSFLLYMGYKWDLQDKTKQAQTRYEWFPSLSVPSILSRLREILNPPGHEDLLAIAKRVLTLAAERISHHDIQYLEVSEADNPRKSFDINTYKAQFVLKDLFPLFSQVMAHYAIPLAKSQSLYRMIENDRLGHLAGGVDREGRDFFTVYHGVKHLPSQQLKSGMVRSLPE